MNTVVYITNKDLIMSKVIDLFPEEAEIDGGELLRHAASESPDRVLAITWDRKTGECRLFTNEERKVETLWHLQRLSQMILSGQT